MIESPPYETIPVETQNENESWKQFSAEAVRRLSLIGFEGSAQQEKLRQEFISRALRIFVEEDMQNLGIQDISDYSDWETITRSLRGSKTPDPGQARGLNIARMLQNAFDGNGSSGDISEMLATLGPTGRADYLNDHLLFLNTLKAALDGCEIHRKFVPLLYKQSTLGMATKNGPVYPLELEASPGGREKIEKIEEIYATEFDIEHRAAKEQWEQEVKQLITWADSLTQNLIRLTDELGTAPETQKPTDKIERDLKVHQDSLQKVQLRLRELGYTTNHHAKTDL